MFDFVIVLVLALFVLAGYRRGFILEIGSIAGFFAGLMLAAAFWVPAAKAIHQALPSDVAAAVLAFSALFVAGYVAVTLLATIARRLAHLLLLGWLDAGLGMILGFIKGAFVLELALLLLARMPTPLPAQALSGSQLAALLQSQQSALFHLVFGAFAGAVPLLSTFY